MRVIEEAEVLWLGRVRRADLARLDLELSLAETASLNEDLGCGMLAMNAMRNDARGGSCKGEVKRMRTGWAAVDGEQRVVAFRQCPWRRCH